MLKIDAVNVDNYGLCTVHIYICGHYQWSDFRANESIQAVLFICLSSPPSLLLQTVSTSFLLVPFSSLSLAAADRSPLTVMEPWGFTACDFSLLLFIVPPLHDCVSVSLLSSPFYPLFRPLNRLFVPGCSKITTMSIQEGLSWFLLIFNSVTPPSFLFLLFCKIKKWRKFEQRSAVCLRSNFIL